MSYKDLIVIQQIAGTLFLIIGIIISKSEMVYVGVIVVAMCGFTQMIIEEIHKAKK